ncbi:MAG: glutamate--tRNA ligase [Candidatus Eutrophobiaceae bacterium]
MSPSGIRTRFAPSPTGFLHIGGVRTALYSWLWARRSNGQFLLRIEDTDKQRESDAAVGAIIEAMQWLGLDHDAEIVYQSERAPAYREAVEKLLSEGHAYWCRCSSEEIDAMRARALAQGHKPRYDGHCRNLGHSAPSAIGEAVARFKQPLEGSTCVDDLVQGAVSYDHQELDDLVLMRSDGMPTYNLAVVVDDAAMGITHVVRGDDHLNNTPKQIQLFNALSCTPPVFAHLPMILDVDGRKLSKRSGAANVLEYRRDGYLSGAVLNYLLRLGWSHGDDEIFQRERMLRLFDLATVNKSAARLNPEKLLWLNRQYLAEADVADLTPWLGEALESEGLDAADGPELRELLEVQKKRTGTLREVVEQSVCFYRDFTDYDQKAAKKHLLRPGVVPILVAFQAACAALPVWEREALHECVKACADSQGLGFGKLAQPIRVAVTGAGVSPSLDDTLYLLGRDKTLRRLEQAVRYVSERDQAAVP